MRVGSGRVLEHAALYMSYRHMLCISVFCALSNKTPGCTALPAVP